MKRNLSILVALSGIALSAHGATPIACYEATAVEIASPYAVQGAYWGLAAGYNYAPTIHYDPKYAVDEDFENLLSFPTEMSSTSKAGWYAMLTLGYRYNSWRFEAEVAYRNNKANQITGLPSTFDAVLTTPPAPPPAPQFNIPAANLTDMPDVTATGTVEALSLMGNIIFDYYYTSGWMWTIGAGAGGARINFGAERSDVNFTTVQNYSNSGYDFTHSVNTFCFQGIFGIAYAWNQHVETAVTYHFFYPITSHYDITNDFITAVPGKPEFTVEFKPNYYSHTVNLEFRFT